MDSTMILGLVAGTLTTAAFFPQFIKAWKSKSTTDISLLMFIILSTGIFLWLIYGLLVHSWPVILANVVTLIIALAILSLKLKYK